nr:pro-sigmaK processing inhibitor BofA family protein [uncultured Dorea sp.]
MKKWCVKIAVNFLIRAIVGLAIIFFVNEYLDGRGISSGVGMNPVTVLTSGTLGIPGVALLYGITFYPFM